MQKHSKKTKKIFWKIFLPIVQIIIVFAVVSFAYNYFSTDRFVKDNAKDEITEAIVDINNQLQQFSYSNDETFTLNASKELLNQGSSTKVYVYDENFNEVTIFNNTFYQSEGLTHFISSLLQNYELDEDVFTNIRHQNVHYLANTYITPSDIDIKEKYFVVLQDLTDKTLLIRESLRNIAVIQFIILLIAIFTIFRIARDLAKPIINLSKESDAYIVGKGVTINSTASDTFEIETLRHALYNMQEKIDEEDKRKNTIYENVAHDLRTPLVSILGYADGLKSGIIKNKNKACDVIIKTGNQLKEMIENILVLSRFDNDTYKGNFEDISVIDLINEQIEVVKVINDEIKISLNADFKNDFIINSDKKLLTRIIQNILSNAIKYAKSEIIINVDAKQNKLKNQSNNKIEISITDDGDGIKKKDLQDIFTRYYKGEDGHFGIGLAVVKSSVEYLNGDISVKSVKGKGTTFKIKI